MLVWRDADPRQNYAAFPESPPAENFKALARDLVALFLEDPPPMYKEDESTW